MPQALLERGQPLLELRGVEKSFGAVRALAGVDLTVEAGMVTALCGDNGAGKSVTIKIISGILTPDDGQILWRGNPVHIHSPRDSAALGIATVYQDLALCDNLDIVQNMFLGRELTKYGELDEAPMERAARHTLADLHVTTVRSIRQPVASLSGGQRQSVAVARAVLWNSQLMILDEPTAALGVAQTAQVLQLVRRLADQGYGVMLVSHNLNDVFDVADRVSVLRLGKMVAQGPISDFDTQSVVEYMTTGTLTNRTSAALRRRPVATGPRRPEQCLSANPTRSVARDPGTRAPWSRQLRWSDHRAGGRAPLAASSEVVADSLGEYATAWWRKVRSGDSGVLPVVIGLVVIIIVFELKTSLFLSAGNIVNLFNQAVVFIMFAIGEVFVLLLGEIDLSMVFVAGIGAGLMAALVAPALQPPLVAGHPGRAQRHHRRSASFRARSSPACGCRRSSSRWPVTSAGRA